MKQARNLKIYVQLLLLSTVSIICFSGAATSDLYSWTDENGKKRFTTSPPPSNQTNVTITPIRQNNNNSAKVFESTKQPRTSINARKYRELDLDNKNATDKELECVWNGMWDALTKGKKGHPSDCVTSNSK